jgi:hypothetical protein
VVHTGFNQPDEGQYDKMRQVDFIEGSCVLIRREVLETAGLLDPSFFAYWEDVDLCLRGRAKGFKCVFVPRARIWHKIGTSIPDATRIRFSARNMMRCIGKNASRTQIAFFAVYFFAFSLWFTMGTYMLRYARAEELLSFLMGIAQGILPPKH